MVGRLCRLNHRSNHLREKPSKSLVKGFWTLPIQLGWGKPVSGGRGSASSKKMATRGGHDTVAVVSLPITTVANGFYDPASVPVAKNIG